MFVKRVDDLLSEQVEDELLVYNRATSEGHALNAGAAAVFALCDGETSREAMIDTVAKQFGLPADADVVELALAELRDAGLVTEDAPRPIAVTRRSVIRKLGLSVAAAAALPIVETMVARPAYAQGSVPPPRPAPAPAPAPAPI